jgi:hypothetical protein
LFVKTVGLLHLCSRFLVLKKINEAVSNVHHVGFHANLAASEEDKKDDMQDACLFMLGCWRMITMESQMPSIDDHRPRRSCVHVSCLTCIVSTGTQGRMIILCDYRLDGTLDGEVTRSMQAYAKEGFDACMQQRGKDP